MRLILIVCFTIFLFTIGCAHSQNCEENINKLPLYGNVKKCPEQIKVDNEFIASIDKVSNRKDAAIHLIKRGWEYFYKDQLDTSIMRFNQAWLLDSLNADIYWGFAIVLGKQQKFKESLPFFAKSLKLNPNNAKVWHDQSVSNGNIFYQTNDKKFLDSTIYSLKRAINIDSTNPQFYGELTSAYCLFMQKDSAKKYLKITDKINPNVVPPDVRAMLTK